MSKKQTIPPGLNREICVRCMKEQLASILRGSRFNSDTQLEVDDLNNEIDFLEDNWSDPTECLIHRTHAYDGPPLQCKYRLEILLDNES